MHFNQRNNINKLKRGFEKTKPVVVGNLSGVAEFKHFSCRGFIGAEEAITQLRNHFAKLCPFSLHH